jgi:hypothetical protein
VNLDPPAAPAGGVRLRTHPLATWGLILSCVGFGIPVVGGLVGATLGAAAAQAIAREPERWDGVSRARAAVAIGLLTGAVPLAVLSMVNDWGFGPLALLLAYGGVIVALVVSARPGGRASAGRVIGGATLGAGGIALGAVVLIGLVLAIVFLFQTMISESAESIGDAACGGS